jgi:hypothetical protein
MGISFVVEHFGRHVFWMESLLLGAGRAVFELQFEVLGGRHIRINQRRGLAGRERLSVGRLAWRWFIGDGSIDVGLVERFMSGSRACMCRHDDHLRNAIGHGEPGGSGGVRDCDRFASERHGERSAGDACRMARRDRAARRSRGGRSLPSLRRGDQPVVAVVAAVHHVAATGDGVGEEDERLAVGVEALDGVGHRQLDGRGVGDGEVDGRRA